MNGVVISVVWLGVYLAARYVLEIDGLGTAARVLVAAAPVVPFGLFLWVIAQRIGRLDELQRRVHLEALALAFPGTLLLLMTLGLLELATTLPKADLSYRHVWPMCVLLYLAGLARARRHYA